MQKGLKASFPLFFYMVEDKSKNPITEKATKKKSSILIFVVAAILVIAFFVVKGSYTDINNALNPPSPEIQLTPSDVNLYKFVDIANNKTLSAEIWLINLGEKPAKNITVFVRARSDNGTVLYQGNISLTSELLRENETCSGILSLKTGRTVHKIFETIEISYDGGRNSYQKETII